MTHSSDLFSHSRHYVRIAQEIEDTLLIIMEDFLSSVVWGPALLVPYIETTGTVTHSSHF